MKLLPDTHLLLWSADDSPKLSSKARALMGAPAHEVYFSLASIWEMAIKHALGRPDSLAHPRLIRNGLLKAGYKELGIDAEHVVAVASLPLLHRDPFDRLLIAQAQVEKLVLLTSDTKVAKYGGFTRLV